MPHICLLLYGPPVFLPVEIVLGEAKFADRDAQLYSGVCQRFYFTLILKLKNPSGREKGQGEGVSGNAWELSNPMVLLFGNASQTIFAGQGVGGSIFTSPAL